MTHTRWPAIQGALLALLAATLFGISTPLVQRVGAGTGPFYTAALLYGGALLVGVLTRRPPQREARLQWGDAPRLLTMAVFGAGIGPVALAWGLQHTTGTSASLLLTLEALFTALLARWFYAESMDRRVWTAMTLLGAGGLLLVIDQGRAGPTPLWGLLAVLGATLAWGIDNTVSRALADRDPGQVVLGKSLLGAATTALIAMLVAEPRPAGVNALGLLAIGASGYGLSLRFYLLAQRAFGAARTGSVFAFAPFIGALVAVLLGDRAWSGGMILACLLMIAGVLLHLAESHAHAHTHEALAHEHAHRHDDGHHDHVHEPMPSGWHSHVHRHEPVTHAHPHVPDVHHAHDH
jgi:drug/metabolite transporter (DMT)-like permease